MIIKVFFLLLFQASLRIFCPTCWMVVCSRVVGAYTANDCPQIKILEIIRARNFFIKKGEESKSALDVLISPHRCKKKVVKLLFLFFHWLFFLQAKLPKKISLPKISKSLSKNENLIHWEYKFPINIYFN